MTYKKQVKEDVEVWNRDGIIYVPHYMKPKVWVSPGYPLYQNTEFTAPMLKKLKAVKTTYKMWRSKYDIK